MIDWQGIIGFDWDAGNSRKSADKHHVSQAEAEQLFFNSPLLILPDEQHSFEEMRLHALGETDERRLLHVTFTLRREGTLIRIVSTRPMNKREQNILEQNHEDDTQISK